MLEFVYEMVLAKEFGAPVMKDGRLKRMINGLEENNLGVFGSLPFGLEPIDRLRILDLSKRRELKSKRCSHGESV